MIENSEDKPNLSDDENKQLLDIIDDAQKIYAKLVVDRIKNSKTDSTSTIKDYLSDTTQALVDAAKKNNASPDIQLLLEGLKELDAYTDIENFYEAINSDEPLPSENVESMADIIKKNSLPHVTTIYEYSDAIQGPGTTLKAFSVGMLDRAVKAPDTIYKLRYSVALKNLSGYLHDFKFGTALNVEDLRPELAVWEYPDDAFREDIGKGSSNELPKTRNSLRAKVQAIESSRDYYGNRVWNKVYGALSNAFVAAQGGIDIATGVENQNDLRLAQGVIGSLTAVEMFSEKVASQFSTKAAKNVTKFAPLVGSFLSASANFASVAKHAEQVKLNAEKGNNARAAAYGVMAALNAISGAIDIAAGICEVLPPPLGLVLSGIFDVCSLFFGLTADLLGFFVETFDSRSAQAKVDERFDAYINSDAFNAYLDNIAQQLKEQGYDKVIFYIDAGGIGITDSEVIRQTVAKEAIVKELRSDAAIAVDTLWRIAIMDMDTQERTHHGGMANDLIRVLSQTVYPGLKTLYGKQGDDILQGGLGEAIIFGGEGNDLIFFNSGHRITAKGDGGNDVILPYATYGNIMGGDMYAPYIGSVDGGAGDDTVVFSPKAIVEGGAGHDTLVYATTSALTNFSGVIFFIDNFSVPEVRRAGIEIREFTLSQDDGPSLGTAYNCEGFENIVINRAERLAMIAIMAYGAKTNIIRVNWGLTLFTGRPTALLILATEGESLITLNNMPLGTFARIYGASTGRSESGGLYYPFDKQLLDNFKNSTVSKQIRKSLSGLAWPKFVDSRRSTTMFVTDAVNISDVKFWDHTPSRDVSYTAKSKIRHIQCSGIQHYILGSTREDRSIVTYDFEGKREAAPSSTITLRDPFANVIGSKGVQLYRLHLAPQSDPQWSIKAAEGQNNMLDLSGSAIDFNISYTSSGMFSAAVDCGGQYTSAISGISGLTLNLASCTVAGSYQGLTIVCNGGTHKLTGGTSKNTFIVNRGQCSINGQADNDTYSVTPGGFPPVTKELLVTIDDQLSQWLQQGKKLTDAEVKAAHGLIRIELEGVELLYTSADGYALPERQDYQPVQLDTYQDNIKIFSQMKAGLVLDMSYIFAAFANGSWERKANITIHAIYSPIGFNGAQAVITTRTKENTLIIPNVKRLDDIIVGADKSGSLTFSTSSNPDFITDTSWSADGASDTMDAATRLQNLADRYALVILPDAQGKREFTGGTLAEYVKDRLCIALPEMQVALSWFTPKFTHGLTSKNVLIIDTLEHVSTGSMPWLSTLNGFSVNEILNDSEVHNNYIFAVLPEVEGAVQAINFKFNRQGFELYALLYNRSVMHFIDAADFGDVDKIIIIEGIGLNDIDIQYTGRYELSVDGFVFLTLIKLPTGLYFAKDEHLIVGSANIKDFLDKKPYTSRGMPRTIEFKEIRVGTHGRKSIDVGFPKTGFENASFTLVPYDSSVNYTWLSSEDWVSVKNGVVSFSEKPQSNRPVYITATPADSTKVTTLYTFSIHQWYELQKAPALSFSDFQNQLASLRIIDGRYEDLFTRAPYRGLLFDWADLDPSVVSGEALPLQFNMLDSQNNAKQIIKWSTPGKDGTHQITLSQTLPFTRSDSVLEGEWWLTGTNLDSFVSLTATATANTYLVGQDPLGFSYRYNSFSLSPGPQRLTHSWFSDCTWLDVTAFGRVIYTERPAENAKANVYARPVSAPVPPLAYAVQVPTWIGIGSARVASPEQKSQITSFDGAYPGKRDPAFYLQAPFFVPLAERSEGIGRMSIVSEALRQQLIEDGRKQVVRLYQCFYVPWQEGIAPEASGT